MAERYRLVLKDENVGKEDYTKYLKGEPDYDTYEEIARDKQLSQEDLRKLFESKNGFIIRGVSENPNCPEDVLEKLTNSDSFCVRENIAEHPNASIEILKRLAKNWNHTEVNHILRNPKVNKELVYLVVENPKLDNNGVWDIINDHSDIVDKKLLDKIINHSSESARWELARMSDRLPENLSIYVLRHLTNDEDEYVRETVARRIDTPVDALEKLVNDKNSDVRKQARISLKAKYEKGIITKEQFRRLVPERKKKPKKTLSERVVVESGSYGLPVNVHLIGNVDKAYKSMKNSQYGFGSPDGAYTDVYIQEAINPEDEDIDCYVGYYPTDVGYSDDDLVQRYIDKGQDDKALARIKRLAKQNGEEIDWWAGTWDDPWSEAEGGYQIDSPEAFEK